MGNMISVLCKPVHKKSINLIIISLVILISLAGSLSAEINYIFQWGALGSDQGEFKHPEGLAIDSDGNVYVTDTLNNRVQKFDLDGNYISEFGSKGSGDGEFKHPDKLAIDSDNNIYVSDTLDNRIQKFDSNGNYITDWGSKGTSTGKFKQPYGVAIDSNNIVYVVDKDNNRIQKFDSNGNYISEWGSSGAESGEFNQPEGIAVDENDNIYVTDANNNRVQKFDSDGNFIAEWGTGGADNGQFQHPKGIYIGNGNNVYVVDSINDRIQKFDSNGNYLLEWGVNGKENSEFRHPNDVCVHPNGNIYVADLVNDRIQVFGEEEPSDEDDDDVIDDEDDYPDDPTKAVDNFYSGTLCFEDKWPSRGDFDMNDLVMGYKYKIVENASNEVVEIHCLFYTRAIGAGYQNSFGIRFQNLDLNNISSATLRINNGEEVNVSSGRDQNKPTYLLFSNAFKYLQKAEGETPFINTESANSDDSTSLPTFELVLVLAQPVNADLLQAPFNPYIIVNKVPGREVHLPGYSPTDKANAPDTFSVDNDEGAVWDYKTDDGYPFALNIPEGWNYPLEKSSLTSAYSSLITWAESGGELAQDWYVSSNKDANYTSERSGAHADLLLNKYDEDFQTRWQLQ
jgi:LruC domain-containing protein